MKNLKKIYSNNINKKILRSIAAIFGSNIISTLLGALGGLLAARFLGPEEMGVFRAFTIPMMYLVILQFGIPDGLFRQLPYYIGKDNLDKVNSLAASAGAWNFFISIIVSIGFLICAFHSLFLHDVKGFFGWFSQVLVCWGIFYGGYLGTTYRTLTHFVSLARIELTQSIISFFLVFLLPIFRFYGLCIRSAIPTIFSLFLLNRNRPLKVKLYFNLKEFKELVTTGLPFFFWIYLGTQLWMATESFLILRFGGYEALGYFGVAIVIREGLSILPQAIHQVLMPKMVEEYARNNDINKINTTLFSIAIVNSVIMVLVTLLSCIVLDIIVPVLIPKYTGGLLLMKITLFYAVVQALSLPLNTLFALGNSWLYGRSILFGILIFFLITWICIPFTGGVIAVAIGSLAGRFGRIIGAYIDLWLLLRKSSDN